MDAARTAPYTVRAHSLSARIQVPFMLTTPIRLIDSTMISRNVRRLRFAHRDGGHFSYRPGEFVSLHLPGENGEPLKRSYSIATLADDARAADTLELVASHVENGRATRWFWQAQPGAEIAFAGPHGQLVWPEHVPQRLILIATGTGVAPYRSMLKQMQPALQQGLTVELLFGVRDASEAFYLEDFRQQAAAFTHFGFTLCMSRAPATAADEFAGRVTARLQQLAPQPDRDLVYLCGNPAMVDEVFEQLKAIGFGVKTVKREKYIFSRV